MTIIIGGGISGLSAAWYLAEAGKSSTLIEKNSRLGGVLETHEWEGCILEGGPDSYLSIKPEATQLARELGLEQDIISSNDDKRITYVWKRNRLVPLPDGMMMMVPTKIMPVAVSPLLSWGTKIRMGIEFLRRPGVPPPERSVADFIRQHYGQETVDYLADPLLSGVYGGDSRALSVNSVLPRFVDLETKYGSLTRGVLENRKRMAQAESGPLFRTLKGGFRSMVDAIQSGVSQHARVIHKEAEALERDGAAWRVRVDGEWISANHVIIATPAYAAGALLRAHDAEMARLLETVDYSSSITISLVYRPGSVPAPFTGFGFLVPKVERRKLLACTFVHNKFNHRAPDGYSIVRCFVGGAGNAQVLDESDEQLLAAVMQDLRTMIGLTAKPDFHRIVRWRRSMAQYTLGHAHRIAQIQRRIMAFPGLHLAGNAYSGIGIPDCVRTGKQAATAVIS
ncbi:MAG: protoporphyrinogen oxidase [Acidobacteria bacterium]|nr:protoporphyrinogen oxidase [Acidobacteriota bacterium]